MSAPPPLPLPVEAAAMLHAAAAAMGIPPDALAPLAPVMALPWSEGNPASERPRLEKDNSLLTPGGCPFEFTFGPEPNRLRITVEPAPGPASPERKWARVTETTGVDAGIRPLLGTLAGLPGQRFGCWLGARIQGGGRLGWKVYQEVPREGVGLTRSFLADALGDSDLAARLLPLLVAAPAEGEGIEVYGRLLRPDPVLVHRLLARAGAPSSFHAVTALLGETTGLSRADLFRGVRLGASLRLLAEEPPGLTFFLHSREVMPTNRVVRQRMGALMRQLSCPLPGYVAAARACGLDEQPFNLHGMLALTPTGVTDLACSIGLRPPDACDAQACPRPRLPGARNEVRNEVPPV